MNTRSHIPLRIRFLHAFAFVALCGTYTMADTNFVQRLYETWAQHDAQALLEFVETSVATNPCLETITAQGLVYGFILGWGAASTNLFEQAKIRALTIDSAHYSDEEKIKIEQCVQLLKNSFISIAEVGGGILSDANVPKTNEVFIAEMFQSCPDKPMFSNCLELFSTLGSDFAQ